MANQSAPLTVYLPAALGSATSSAPSRFPCLDKLIARGDVQRSALRGDGVLLALMGGATDAGSSRAALLHYAQQRGARHEEWRVIVSPLHLTADHQTVHLLAEQPVPVRDAESRALFAATQAFFAEEGWQLDYGEAGHWTLHLSAHTAITTTAPGDAAGRPLFETLPQGRDAAIWRRWGNEAQMLFHTHPVNEARRRLGEPPINSLWFWGEGPLPQLGGSPLRQVVGGDHYVQGLARLAGITWQPLPQEREARDTLLNAASLLLVLDHAAQTEWDEWFCAIATLLRRRRIRTVELHFQDGHQLRITAAMWWRLWRRRRLTLTGSA